MVTAEQARDAVRIEQKITCRINSTEECVIKACERIIDKINNGWLCANISDIIKTPNDRYLIIKHLEPLGYVIDKDIIFWTFG